MAADSPNAVSDEIAPVLFYHAKLNRISDQIFEMLLTVDFDAYYIGTFLGKIPCGIKMVAFEARTVGGIVPSEGLWPKKGSNACVVVHRMVQ